MEIGAVIFDCDGTLVDSERVGNEVLVEYMAEFGLQLTQEEAIGLFRGRKMDDCATHLEQLLGKRLPDSFVPELRARTAIAFQNRLHPTEGALDLVQSLSIPICVASSSPREKIELSLAVCGLLPYFRGRIFSSYDVGTWKPDPGLFLHAAQQRGVRANACAVIEDSLPGIRAGIAAGMMVFALQYSKHEDCPVEARIIQSLSELSGILAP